MTDVPNYRVGPQPAGPLYVPDAPNNREGPQAREPSKYPNGRSYRETGQRGLLIASKRGLKKDFDRATTPAVEAVCVPAHLAPPGSPQAKQLCHLHAQLPLGQSFPRQKKKLLHLCPILCDPVDCGLSGFSVREGGSPGKNTGVCCPVLVVISF